MRGKPRLAVFNFWVGDDGITLAIISVLSYTNERTTYAKATTWAETHETLQWLPIQSTRAAHSNASTVGALRFHGGGGRPVFGLWAAYSIAASHLIETVRWLAPCNVSFPSPLRDSAGFTPASRLTNLPCGSLTCTLLVYMGGG